MLLKGSSESIEKTKAEDPLTKSYELIVRHLFSVMLYISQLLCGWYSFPQANIMSEFQYYKIRKLNILYSPVEKE